MKLLTFTSLYPNAIKPSHGVFVENRLRHLVDGGRVESRVIAPVPWFPSKHPGFGRYADFARVPHRETRHGLEVHHPRYPMIPAMGMSVVPLTMALFARKTVTSLIASGFDFDAIDAHYFFPDGVAAMLLGKWFDRPVVVTARGSDINVLPQYALPRRMIRWAAREAAAIVTVSSALKRGVVDLGIAANKIVVLRNGVDLDRFAPRPMREARARLGVPADGAIVVSVGHLVELKGHDLAIEAVAAIPGATLIVAGSGPERSALEKHAKRLGVSERVRFLGQVAHDALPDVYGAANVLLLASSTEGWANVLLEAMACGTPAISTDVGGSAEVVSADAAGRIVSERSPSAIVAAVVQLLADPPDRAATRRYAERFSWDETTRGQEQIFTGLSVPANALQLSDAKS